MTIKFKQDKHKQDASTQEVRSIAVNFHFKQLQILKILTQLVVLKALFNQISASLEVQSLENYAYLLQLMIKHTSPSSSVNSEQNVFNPANIFINHQFV